MPLPAIAAYAPMILGGLSSLLGLGKGKEIPKESEANTKMRSQLFNYMMPGGQLRQNTPFMGTRPGVQSGFYDALNMLSMFYGGKPYKQPKRQGFQDILGLPSSSGAQARPGAPPYPGFGGGFNPYEGGGMGGMGGGYGMTPGAGGGGYGRPAINPWAMYGGGGGGGMSYRPLD